MCSLHTLHTQHTLSLAVCRLSKLLSFERALDTIVWQLLASVICPGEPLPELSKRLQQSTDGLRSAVLQGPCAACLFSVGAVPFTITVGQAATSFMDS